MTYLGSMRVLALVIALQQATFAQSEDPHERPRSTAARELFLVNCASCHGERGDGEGVTDLDRKARSFKEGGFSYGNTPGTLRRTISSGIPGTPMPGFGGALKEKQIADLAMYVLELGPGLPPEPNNTELVVGERPLVVRGMLPPIAEGALAHPRGLLIGRPDGFSFEYRADDVRLLGVRQGRFVDRTDWIGRGGTALKPLGKVVALVGGGDPGASFSRVDEGTATPLRAELVKTRIAGPGTGARVYQPEIVCHLSAPTGEVVARLVERASPVTLGIGAGYKREWYITALADSLQLKLNGPDQADLTFLGGEADGLEVMRRKLSGIGVEYTVVVRRGSPSGAEWSWEQNGKSGIFLKRHEHAELSVWVIQVTEQDLREFGEDRIGRELKEAFKS